jgi:hypothetical protein
MLSTSLFNVTSVKAVESNFKQIQEKFGTTSKRKPKSIPTCIAFSQDIAFVKVRSLTFAKALQVPHKKFNASKGQRVTEKVYHVQNVNNMDMRLRKWMQPFNGVATKYLQNYLNWFLVLEKIKHNTRKLAIVSGIMFASNTTWFEYKQQVYHSLFRT